MDNTEQFQSPTDELPSAEAERGGSGDRLLGLMEEVRAFLQVQLDRLEQAWTDCEVILKRERTLDERQRQLERREQELKAAHDEQTRRLDAEYTRLTEAWDRLESETRQMLATGQASPAAAPSVASVETPRINGGPVPAAAVDVLQPAAEPPATVPGGSETWSPEQSAIQFQQLKREIGRHARRR